MEKRYVYFRFQFSPSSFLEITPGLAGFPGGLGDCWCEFFLTSRTYFLSHNQQHQSITVRNKAYLSVQICERTINVNQALIDAGNVCAEADVIITIHSITIRVLYIYSANLFPFPCTKLSAAGTEIIIR